MSNYDVAIGMSEATLNDFVRSVYARTADQWGSLFSGTKTVNVAALKEDVKVLWQVQQPPRIVLQPPDERQWKIAVKADGNAAAPETNAFTVVLPALRVGRQQGGGAFQETVTSVDAICTVALVAGVVAIQPLALGVDLSSASSVDKIIFSHILIPAVLEQVRTMLAGQHFPRIDFHGLAFDAMNLGVGGGRLLGVANLADVGGPPPAVPPLESMPQDGFYALLSPRALQRIIDNTLSQAQGRSLEKSGSQDSPVGSAQYSARVDLQSVAASPDPGDPTRIAVNADFGLAVNAGVSVFDAVWNRIKDGAGKVGDIGKKAGEGIVDIGKKAGEGAADIGRKAGNKVVNIVKGIGDLF